MKATNPINSILTFMLVISTFPSIKVIDANIQIDLTITRSRIFYLNAIIRKERLSFSFIGTFTFKFSVNQYEQ